MTNVTELRLSLQANGYAPVPVCGKAAYQPGWQTKTNASAAEIQEWAKHPDWSNTGVLTATTPAIDLDIKDPEAADACEGKLREWFDGYGVLITRFGAPPKRALLFRTPEPFKKIRADFISPSGGEHHIEVLCDGQQIVVEGIHPDSRRPYSWYGGQGPLTVKRENLPKINESAAARAVELLSEMLVAEFGFEPVQPGRPKGNSQDAQPDLTGKVDVEAELAAMQPKTTNDVQCRVAGSLLTSRVPEGLSYDDIVVILVNATMAMAKQHYRLRGWTREKEFECVYKRLANLLKSRCKALTNDELSLAPGWVMPELAGTWDEIVEKSGRPCILHDKRAGWLVRNMAWAWDCQDDGNPADESKEAPTQEEQLKAEAGTSVSSWCYFGTTNIEPPKWLIKNLLPETGILIQSGPWGTFKTSIALDTAVSIMALTMFAGQYRVKRNGGVLYFATEGAGSLQYRLAAIAHQRGAPRKLPFAWRGDCPKLTDKKAGPAIVKLVAEAVEEIQKTFGVSIVAIWFDTYITAAGLSSSGDDNDSAATQKAFATLRYVTDNTGALVVVIDHMGKTIEAGTRGSSSKEDCADAILACLADRD